MPRERIEGPFKPFATELFQVKSVLLERSNVVIRRTLQKQMESIYERHLGIAKCKCKNVDVLARNDVRDPGYGQPLRELQTLCVSSAKRSAHDATYTEPTLGTCGSRPLPVCSKTKPCGLRCMLKLSRSRSSTRYNCSHHSQQTFSNGHSLSHENSECSPRSISRAHDLEPRIPAVPRPVRKGRTS